MVKVSTLFYVLENLEEGKAINPDEILDMENNILSGVFGAIDRHQPNINPALIDRIIQTAGTF